MAKKQQWKEDWEFAQSVLPLYQDKEKDFWDPFWQVGEWRTLHVTEYNRSYDILKKCKCYFSPDGNIKIKSWAPENGKDKRSMPKASFERWFVTEEYGCKYLCNCNKSDGSCEGVPGDKLYEVTGMSLSQIIAIIDEGSFYNWKKYDRVAPKCSRLKQERILPQELWSNKYDGMHIMMILSEKPKMTFEEVCRVIRNEGGSVDNDGFIHKAQ